MLKPSPSMRREWIEILLAIPYIPWTGSPSMRREWIEIFGYCYLLKNITSLPPCGGSGLKCRYTAGRVFGKMSPSMRREWIEIPHQCLQTPPMMSPSMRREWIEMAWKPLVQTHCGSLPPCGGSGLKCTAVRPADGKEKSPSMRREWIEIICSWASSRQFRSPSMRREWIEIAAPPTLGKLSRVSLHAEGVD